MSRMNVILTFNCYVNMLPLYAFMKIDVIYC